MSETTSSPSRRRGGAREAMRAARAAPLPDNLRPVRPGMEGGRYKPLTDADVLKIHHAALDARENIGFADATPSGIEYMTKAGAVLRSDGRLVFPRALVEDTLAHAGRKFVLYGQDPKHDMEPWGSKVYFGTAGAAVNMVDPVTMNYRESTTKDSTNTIISILQVDRKDNTIAESIDSGLLTGFGVRYRLTKKVQINAEGRFRFGTTMVYGIYKPYYWGISAGLVYQL